MSRESDALLRIEKKLDELLKLVVSLQKTEPGRLPLIIQPLSSRGQVCPLCQRGIHYLLSQEGEAIRICSCVPTVEYDQQQGE